jgi:hypothetical protein
MARKFRAARPAQLVAAPDPEVELTLFERRARAFRRVWPLLSTSIPTRDLVTSYLDEVLTS